MRFRFPSVGLFIWTMCLAGSVAGVANGNESPIGVWNDAAFGYAPGVGSQMTITEDRLTYHRVCMIPGTGVTVSSAIEIRDGQIHVLENQSISVPLSDLTNLSSNPPFADVCAARLIAGPLNFRASTQLLSMDVETTGNYMLGGVYARSLPTPDPLTFQGLWLVSARPAGLDSLGPVVATFFEVSENTYRIFRSYLYTEAPPEPEVLSEGTYEQMGQSVVLPGFELTSDLKGMGFYVDLAEPTTFSLVNNGITFETLRSSMFYRYAP